MRRRSPGCTPATFSDCSLHPTTLASAVSSPTTSSPFLTAEPSFTRTSSTLPLERAITSTMICDPSSLASLSFVASSSRLGKSAPSATSTEPLFLHTILPPRSLSGDTLTTSPFVAPTTHSPSSSAFILPSLAAASSTVPCCPFGAATTLSRVCPPPPLVMMVVPASPCISKSPLVERLDLTFVTVTLCPGFSSGFAAGLQTTTLVSYFPSSPLAPNWNSEPGEPSDLTNSEYLGSVLTTHSRAANALSCEIAASFSAADDSLASFAEACASGTTSSLPLLPRLRLGLPSSPCLTYPLTTRTGVSTPIPSFSTWSRPSSQTVSLAAFLPSKRTSLLYLPSPPSFFL